MAIHGNEGIDTDARELSTKILLILYIVVITFLNIGLCLGLLVQGKLLNSPRRFIVFSMAICNIILALFGILVGDLLWAFDAIEFDKDTCKAQKLAIVYYNMHNFVSAFGLMTLCVELILRRMVRQECRMASSVVGFIFSGLPWGLGVVVILPLCLTDYDFEYCRYSRDPIEREKITFYIGTIGPAAMAVILSIVTMVSYFSPEPDCCEDRGHEQPSRGDVPLAPYYPTQAGYVVNQPPGVFPNVAQPVQNPPAVGYPGPTTTSTYGKPDMYPNLQPYAPYNPPYQPQPPPQNLPPTFIPQPVVAPYPANPATSQRVLASSRAEKKTLLLLSCLFAVCVLPSVIFALAYTLEPGGDLSDIAYWSLRLGFAYLSFTWAVLSPIIWMAVLFGGRNSA